MANETYSSMNTILSKTPILPAALPRLTLTKNGTLDYTASTGSYNIYRWNNDFGGFPFEQNASNMGNYYNAPGSGGDNGFSGFAKDSQGKVYQVVPWMYLSNHPGARISYENFDNSGRSTVIYPNPLSKNQDITIVLSTTVETPLSIKLIDHSGSTIKELKDNLSIGSHTFSIPLDQIGVSTEFKFIYVKLKTLQHNETKRILLSR